MVRAPAVVREFGAPYGRSVKVVTSAVASLLVSLSAYGLYLLLTASAGDALLPLVALVCAPLLVLLVPLLFSPRGYALTEEGVLIRRPLKDILIPYDSVVDVRVIAEGVAKWGVRLWGSGGLYGFVGLFHLGGLGRVWMYVTDPGRVVLVETVRGTKYAASPSDPVEFAEAVKLHLSGRGRPSTAPPAEPRPVARGRSPALN